MVVGGYLSFVGESYIGDGDGTTIGQGGEAAPFPFIGLLLAAGGVVARIKDMITDNGVFPKKRI
jgi:hypothetical protein